MTPRRLLLLTGVFLVGQSAAFAGTGEPSRTKFLPVPPGPGTVVVEAVAPGPAGARPKALKLVEVRVEDFERQTGVALPQFHEKWGQRSTFATATHPAEGPKSGKRSLKLAFTQPHRGGWGMVWSKRVLLPGEPASATAWGRGAAGSRVTLHTVFRDAAGFQWFGGGPPVHQAEWRKRAWGMKYRDLGKHWRKPKAVVYPLEFIGLRQSGNWGRDATATWAGIDDLRIVCEVDKAMPCFVKVEPTFDFKPGHEQKVFAVVQAFDGGFGGSVAFRVLRRNGLDFPFQNVSLGKAKLGAGQTASLVLDWTPPTPGRYEVEFVTTPEGGTPYIHRLALLAVSRDVQAAGVARWQARELADTRAAPLAAKLSLDEALAKDFACVSTELFPGWVVKAKTPQLVFFNSMSSWGLGPPAHYAVTLDGTVKVFDGDFEADGAAMTENWVLAWFAGAKGWDDFDVPFLLVLQRKPKRLRGTADGLVLEFKGEAGHVVWLPLYGFYKPPQKGRPDLVAKAGFDSKGIHTWQWAEGVPTQVLWRVRYWSVLSREIPIECTETFALDFDTDSVVIRNRFKYLSIKDEWETAGLRFAPVPPTLAAAKFGPPDTKAFPVTFTSKLTDPDVFTPYGPYLGVEGKDEVEFSIKCLSYLHQAEVRPKEVPKGEVTQRALKWLQRLALVDFVGGPDAPPDLGNFVWSIPAAGVPPKAIPYLDGQARYRAAAQAMTAFESLYCNPKSYDTETVADTRYHIKYGPGIDFGIRGDAGKLSCHGLFSIWSYAFHTGDWQLVRDRWAQIRSLMTQPLVMSWKTVGREAIAEMGDEAAPALAYARMALAIGRKDDYRYGAYLFARELVHHYVKQAAGRNYFLRNQPVDATTPIKGTVFWDNCIGETAAWRFSGPDYPDGPGEKQYWNRYVRFNSEDVARFHRDVLQPDAQRELDLYAANARAKKGAKPALRFSQGVAHGLPSLVRLYSYILGTGPDELARLAPPETAWTGNAQAAAAAAYLRNAAGAPPLAPLAPRMLGRTDFDVGLQRAPTTGWHALVLPLHETRGFWPAARWFGWPPPKRPVGGLDMGPHWPFGLVKPGANLAVRAVRRISGAINWNTTVHACDVLRWTDQEVAAYEKQAQAPWLRCGPFESGHHDHWIEARKARSLVGPERSKAERRIRKRLTESIYKAMDAPCPPESAAGKIDPAATYPGALNYDDFRNPKLEGKPIVCRWERTISRNYVTSLRVGFKYGIFYGHTWVHSPKAQKVVLGLGFTRACKVWVNDRPVFESNREPKLASRRVALDQDRTEVRLDEGWNKLLVKTPRVGWNAAFALRLQTPDERPIPGLVFSPDQKK